MKVLIACEESQAVCKEFRALGHEAYSADVQICSGGHEEWHILGDVLEVLNGGEFITQDGKKHLVEKWDMIIAFPPCTHLAVSGAMHFEQKIKDGRQQQGVDFFMKFAKCNCERVAIENPIGIMSDRWKKPTQIIQPWQFGDPFQKSTCLWLKNLPPLKPTVFEKPEMEFKEWICKKTGKKKRQAMWFFKALQDENTGKTRSKTFPGIAKAMAQQFTQPFMIQGSLL